MKKPFAIGNGLYGLQNGCISVAQPRDVGLDIGRAVTPLALSVTASVSGSRTGSGLVTSDPAVVSVLMGPVGASYRYLWTQFSGTAMDVMAAGPAAVFGAQVNDGATVTAKWRCQVLNDYGQELWTTDVDVSLTANTSTPSTSATVSPGGGFSPQVLVSQVANSSFATGFSVSTDASVPSYNWYNSPGYSMSGAATANMTVSGTVPQGTAVEFIVGVTVTDTSDGGNGSDGASVRWANLNP